MPAVGLLLYACSEAALRSVGPTAASSNTRSQLDTASGYAPWPFAVLAPPATAAPEDILQNGIGLFDPPPGPVPADDFVAPAPTAEDSGVAVLITPTDVANRPPPTAVVRRTAPAPATLLPGASTGTPTGLPDDTPIVPGQDGSPTMTPLISSTPSATLLGPTRTPTPTRTATDLPPSATSTRTPSRTPSPTPTRTASRTPTRTPSRTPTRTPSRTPTFTPEPTATASPTLVVMGTIQGQVRRPNGSGVPGVSLSLSNGAGTTTGGAGFYHFDNVPAGVYTVTPHGAGDCFFAPASRGVMVDGGTSYGISFVMHCPDPPTATSPPPTATDPPTPVPPTPTLVPTHTPPPTFTPPPTPTDPPPTSTDPPPTATDPPPTATDPPPTATDPPPPTATDPPPTATDPPPSDTSVIVSSTSPPPIPTDTPTLPPPATFTSPPAPPTLTATPLPPTFTTHAGHSAEPPNVLYSARTLSVPPI